MTSIIPGSKAPKLAKSGFVTPRRVKRKWIKTIEIDGVGVYELESNERVVDSRIIHEVVELSQPSSLRLRYEEQRAFPKFKTIVVLECVEFEVDE